MIAVFLKELKYKGILQIEIAKVAGISQAQVSRLSKGEKPSIDVVIKLADHYGVTTDHVLGRGDDGTTGSEHTCSRSRGNDDNGDNRFCAFHSLDNVID